MSATAAAAAHILNLPDAVALHLAQTFLEDAEARSLGTTCHALLVALRPYRIARELTLSAALAFFGGAVETDSQNGGALKLDGVVSRWKMGRPSSCIVAYATLLSLLPRVTSLQTLRLDLGQVDPSSPITLPSSLNSLYFGGAVGLASVAHPLPTTLHTIRLPWRCEPGANGLDRLPAWPPGLTELSDLDDHAPIATWTKLPEGLTVARFGSRFNQPIPENWLPQSTTSISFGYASDRPLSNQLPLSLKQLHLRSLDYSHPLDLSHLKQFECVLLPIPSSSAPTSYQYATLRLPESLRELVLTRKKGLVVSYSDLRLPASLARLTLDSDLLSLESMRWPEGLGPLKLELLPRFNDSLPAGHLPPSLTALELGNWDLPCSQLVLPARVTSLSFSQHSPFNQPVDQLVLPAGLTSLRFGDSFNQSLAKLRLPAALTSLQLGNHWNQKLDEVLFPSGLQELTLFYSPIYFQDGPVPRSLTNMPKISAVSSNRQLAVGFFPRSLALVRIHIPESRLDHVRAAWEPLVAELPHCRLKIFEYL